MLLMLHVPEVMSKIHESPVSLSSDNRASDLQIDSARWSRRYLLTKSAAFSARMVGNCRHRAISIRNDVIALVWVSLAGRCSAVG